MASSSWKKEMYQQIANSQVQQVMQQQREQGIAQLQAEFNAWQKQQNDIAQLQAEYDSWYAQNNPQPVQSAPVQTIKAAPKQEAKQEPIPSLADFFKPTTASGKDVNKEAAVSQAEEREKIQEQKAKRKESINNTLNMLGTDDFKDMTKKGKAQRVIEQRKAENEAIEKQIAGLDTYNTDNLPQLTDDQKVLEEQILNADRYVENTPKERWNERFLTKQEKASAINNTTQADVDRWLSPETKLTQKEKGIARAYAAAELAKIPTNASTHQPNVQTEEEKQHYRDMVEIMNKTNPVSSAMTGFVELPFNLVDMVGDAGRAVGDQISGLGAAVTDKLGITEGATQRNNERIEAANESANAKEENFRRSIGNAQTQYPGAYTGGKIAGQITAYALTNPVFDGIAEGAGVTNQLAKFFINQGAQNAQDLALDTAPLVKQLMSDGSMSEEDKREVFNNVVLNALGNAAMGTVQEIPNIAQYVGGKVDARRAADEAFRQNVRAGADNLARLAGTEDVDNVVRNATRQAEEAAQNIQDISKQIPEFSDDIKLDDSELKTLLGGMDPTNTAKQIPEIENYATDILGDAKPYDVVQDINEDDLLKDSLINDALKRIGQPIDDLDKSGIMEGITNKAALKNYENMKAAYEEYATLLLNKDATYEELEAAARKLGNARKNFGRNMKNIDPEIAKQFDNMAYGELINQPMYNRLGTTKTPQQLDDELRAVYMAEGKSPEEIEDLIAKSHESTTDYGYDALRDPNAIIQEEFEEGQRRLEELMNGTKASDVSESAKAPEANSAQIDLKALKKEANNMKTSFREKAKYLRDTDNPYARKFLESVDEFTKDPSVDTYEMMVSAHNDYMANYNKDIWKPSKTGYYHPEYHSEQIVKRLDDIAEKYGFKNGPQNDDSIKNSLDNVNTSVYSDVSDSAENLPINNNKVMAEDIGINPKPQEPDSVKGEWKIEDTPENAPTGPKPPISEGEVVPPEGMKERGQSRHIRNDGTPMKMEGVSDEVLADFQDNPDMYNVLRNADTKAKADRIFEESANPEVEFRDMLRQHDPAALPLGHQIAKQYSASGNHEAAAQIYREMGEQLTKAGQFSQAAAINMMKNDPLTAFNYAEKQIDSLNVAGKKKFGNKWKDFNLTDSEKALFDNIEPGDTDAIKNAFDTIGNRIGKEYPTTMLEKTLEGRKIAMLFNLRTMSRNVFANVPTRYMRMFSDRLEAVGQNVVHLVDPDYKVTQSLTGGGKEARKLATEKFNSDAVQQMIKGTPGKYEIPELKNSMLDNKQMFKGTLPEKFIDRYSGEAFNKIAKILNKDVQIDGGIQALNKKLYGKEGVQSILETIRNTTYKLLDLGDTPFVRANFVDRLSSYIKAQGIKNLDDIPDEAVEIAWEEAMKATYKDNSWAVKMTQGVKNKGIGSIPYIGKPLGDALIPFVQAPANIAARMVDYSPIRGSKGIYDIFNGATKSNPKQLTRGIEELAKGLTGTAAAYLGMKLYDAGILTGAYSEDKDQKAFQQQHGFREYALKYGPDKYYTINWAQPAFQSIMSGVIVADALKNADEYDSMLLEAAGYDDTSIGKAIGVGKQITKGSLNSWFDQSTMQNIQELFSGGYGGATDIAGNIAKIAINDFGGSFVPSTINAAAKTVDTTQRNTTDKSNIINNFLNQQQAKIPELSKELPAKYDTWGNEMKYANSTAEAAFNRFLNPGEGTTDTSDEIDNEINRLFDVTEEKGVFPPVAPTAIGQRKLNNEEVSTYQEDMGKRNRSLAEGFINSDIYKSTDDKEKAEILSNMYGASKAITERDKFDKEVSKSSNYKAAIEAYDSAGGGKKGEQAILEYYTAKSASDQAGLAVNSNAAKAIQQDIKDGNTEAAQEKIDAAQQLPVLGLDKPGPTYTYYTAQETIPGLTVDQFAKTYKGIDSNNNQGIDQKELLAYINKTAKSESEAQELWKAYGGWKNKKGETKKLVKGKDGKYTATY